MTKKQIGRGKKVEVVAKGRKEDWTGKYMENKRLLIYTWIDPLSSLPELLHAAIDCMTNSKQVHDQALTF